MGYRGYEGFYGGSVGFRDNAGGQEFASTYDSPGWRRAQANRAQSGGYRTRPPLIEAQAYAVQTSDPSAMQFARYEADALPPRAVLLGISNSGSRI